MGAPLPNDVDPKSLQTNSSVKTIMTLTNCMIGGTMLLLPKMTLETGYIMTPIVLFISCFVSYITCSIYTKHMKLSEMDIQYTIKRILGYKWYVFFVITCTFYKYFLCVLYYFYIVELLYKDIAFIGRQIDPKTTSFAKDEDDLTFKKFSVVYVMFGTFPLLFLALSYRNLKVLVKLTEYGIYAIYAYLIFIIYCFIDNLTKDHVHQPQNDLQMPLNAFTFNIGNLGGTAALAFTIHTSFGNMIKCNKNQSNNVRDLGIAYGCGLFIYMSISVLGAFGIVNRLPYPGSWDPLPNKMTGYFGPKHWGPFIVDTMYLLNILSVLPIFWDVSKRRFIPLINKGEEICSNQMNYIINIIFLVTSIGIKFSGFDITYITGFNGSLCCFFFVYLIPIIMHFTCYHGKNNFLRGMQRKFSQMTATHALPENPDDDEPHVHEGECDDEDDSAAGSFVYGKHTHDDLEADLLQKSEKLEIDSSQVGSKQGSGNNKKIQRTTRAVSCANHDDVELGKNALIMRFVFYSIIGIVGLAILVNGMYTFFDKIISGTEDH